jgi:hypothetical protein
VAAAGVNLGIFDLGYGFGTAVFGRDVGWLEGCSVVSTNEGVRLSKEGEKGEGGSLLVDFKRELINISKSFGLCHLFSRIWWSR